MKFTLSVRSFQVPATPFTSAWPPSLPSVPTSRATRVTSEANELSWSTIVLMVFFSSRISPLTSTVIFLRQVAVGDGGGDLGDVAHLAGQVAGHRVHVVGEVLPRAGDAPHLGLAAELALGADLARHAGHLGGERVELVDHRVDGVLQLEDLALTSTVIFLRQVAVGDGGRRPRRCCAPGRSGCRPCEFTLSVRSFQVPATPLHLGLAAELALGADLARHARHLGGERAELIDHRVDGVLQLEDLALHVDGDLLATGRRWRPRWSPRRCCAPGR